MAPRWARTATAAGLALAAATLAHAQSRNAAAAADSAPSTPADVELERITVTPPPINPLDASRERLRQMLEDAPCLGCGTLQDDARISVYEKTYYGVGAVLSFFSGMPEHPPEMTEAERVEARVAGDWRRYERAAAEVD